MGLGVMVLGLLFFDILLLLLYVISNNSVYMVDNKCRDCIFIVFLDFFIVIGLF